MQADIHMYLHKLLLLIQVSDAIAPALSCYGYHMAIVMLVCADVCKNHAAANVGSAAYASARRGGGRPRTATLTASA